MPQPARNSFQGPPEPRGPRRTLRVGGIEWVIYLAKSEVPRRGRPIGVWIAKDGYLRLAVTYGAPDWGIGPHESTTAVHLRQMVGLPPTVCWHEVFLHVFTYEPLPHALSLAPAELDERGDQEWAIERLGDDRWW